MTVQTFHTITCDDCGACAKTTGRGVRPLNWGGPWRGVTGNFGEDYCPKCTRERVNKDWPEDIDHPYVGMEIYIPSAFYIDHGEDDVQGGLATINAIEYNPGCPNAVNRAMVRVLEVPHRSYNYLLAMREQKERAKEYGDRRAFPDPDIDSGTGFPNRY